MRTFAMTLSGFYLASAPAQSQPPWDGNHHSTDAAKRHVEPIVQGRHVYTVRHGGTMDGTNCRSPIGVGMMDGPAIQQTWESNRSVRLENIGETDVVNPWLANGRNSFRTLREIVASAVTPGMTDREKATAIYFQQIRHRYHWSGDNNELGDPVKLFNVYGHNTCGNDSICLAGLWRQAGLKVSPARVVGHCITQAYFDNRWNLFDGDMHSLYLLRDNRTIASEQDLVRDHDLIRRSHTQGILNPDKRANDEWESSIFVFEGKPAGDRRSATDTTMNMVLRPGESITWSWGHAQSVKFHGDNPPRYPNLICNGRWEYRPSFAGDLWKKGAVAIENVRTERGELLAEEGKVAFITWTIRSPYVMVGGKLEAEASGARFSLSWDGKTWTAVGANLDKWFPSNGPARYEYRLKCELPAGARLQRLTIANDLQMAPLALPGITVGANEFVYTDQSPGGRKVRITHNWVERSATRPPSAPTEPLFPRDGSEPAGTDLVLRWQPAQDPDGDAIADYQFELSERPDMRWPLSTNFDKLISKTADRGKAQYTLPHTGLLAADRKYYWHVRAQDRHGVWGPWSATWSFTPRGPTAPIDVTLTFNSDRSLGTLRWKPGATSGKPAKYRIYASDEKGFTISDEPFKAVVGGSKEVPALRPANFVAEISAAEAAVIGLESKLPNKAFYRVVAVDENGKRSGPSDYVESPRPILYSQPVTEATVGKEYRYSLTAIRSIGDLRTRVVNGKEAMNYWDVESPRFTLRKGPKWLKIDAASGLLSGVPDRAATQEVIVAAAIDREVRNLDAGKLMWGLEKVDSTKTQRIGIATQKFAIRVAP